jgi:hypothetical protein
VRKPSSVEVHVRCRGATYFARAGYGKKAKIASATQSAYWAALMAAAKYLQPGRAVIRMIEISDSIFIAKKGGAS